MDPMSTKVQEKETVEFVRNNLGPSELRSWATYNDTTEKMYATVLAGSRDFGTLLFTVIILLIAAVSGFLQAILIMLTRAFYDAIYPIFRMVLEAYKYLMTALMQPFYGLFGKIVTTKENVSTSGSAGPEYKV